jgi:hypothetical protein
MADAVARLITSFFTIVSYVDRVLFLAGALK